METTTEEDVVDAPKTIRDSIQYELKEIEKKSKKLKDLIDAKKGQVG